MRAVAGISLSPLELSFLSEISACPARPSTLGRIDGDALNTGWSHGGNSPAVRRELREDVTLQTWGYGYAGSSDSHNRTIQAITAAFRRVFWSNKLRDPSVQRVVLLAGSASAAPGRPARASLNVVLS